MCRGMTVQVDCVMFDKTLLLSLEGWGLMSKARPRANAAVRFFTRLSGWWHLLLALRLASAAQAELSVAVRRAYAAARPSCFRHAPRRAYCWGSTQRVARCCRCPALPGPI